MKVYVVIRNDYPECVFSTEEAADRFVDEQEVILRSNPGTPWVHWRHYEFEVDAKAPASTKEGAS